MILVVDDSNLLRERLVNLLSEVAGGEVIGQARNADEALELIQSVNPRVVILDIQMPGVNGIEALKAIKQRSNPPGVIMLTNHPQQEYREKCLALGADYFLDKTRDLDKLTGICKSLIEQYSNG